MKAIFSLCVICLTVISMSGCGQIEKSQENTSQEKRTIPGY
jgi:uncharacterized lipoprotein YehR (DUF1307 family)